MSSGLARVRRRSTMAAFAGKPVPGHGAARRLAAVLCAVLVSMLPAPALAASSQLTGASIDMTYGTLTLVFNTPMWGKSLDPTKITIQSNTTVGSSWASGSSVALTGNLLGTSSNGTTLTLGFPEEDYLALLEDVLVANSAADTFIVAEAGVAQDAEGLDDSAARPDGEGVMVYEFLVDRLAPVLLRYVTVSLLLLLLLLLPLLLVRPHTAALAATAPDGTTTRCPLLVLLLLLTN